MALFSDIHGNITGLNAVLAAIDTLGDVDVLVAAGDLVLGGAGTDDVVDRVVERQVRLVRGNAEEIVLDLDQAWMRNVEAGYPADGRDAWMHELRPLVEWTASRLSQRSRDLLAALPLVETVEMSPGRRLLAWHATPQSTWPPIGHPDTPIEVVRAAYGAVEADVVAFGHLHFPHIQWLDHKHLVNVGCVAARAERPGVATFTTVEHKHERWSVQQREVAYDAAEEARLNVERGVPGG